MTYLIVVRSALLFRLRVIGHVHAITVCLS